jgi:hypothetical protein
MVIFSNFKIGFTLAILTPILYYLRKLSLAIKELCVHLFMGYFERKLYILVNFYHTLFSSY